MYIEGKDDYIANYLKNLKNESILKIKEYNDTETQRNYADIKSCSSRQHIFY